MVRQAGPPQSMEGSFGAEVQLQPLEDPILDKLDAWRGLFLHGELTPGQAPGRTCALVETGVHAGEGLLVVLVTLRGIHTGTAWFWGTGPCEGGTGAVCGELQPVGMTHAGEVHEGLCSMGGTPFWSRMECRDHSIPTHDTSVIFSSSWPVEKQEW